jgi:hypothetical protein
VEIKDSYSYFKFFWFPLSIIYAKIGLILPRDFDNPALFEEVKDIWL